MKEKEKELQIALNNMADDDTKYQTRDIYFYLCSFAKDENMVSLQRIIQCCETILDSNGIEPKRFQDLYEEYWNN